MSAKAEPPTITEALDLLMGVMGSVPNPIEDVLKILFVDVEHSNVRDILYAYLDEPRQESRDERGDRLAKDAVAWAPIALEKLTRETGQDRFFSADRVGAVAAEMASGARGYFGDSE